VGSLAVLNVQVEKIEDQKLYMSCVAQSRDQQIVYAKSSGKEVLSLSSQALVSQNKGKGGRTLRSIPRLGSIFF
jgi:hypothetical protein